MSALPKDVRPKKTFHDWLGLLCFFGCLIATVGLSCFGIASIFKKGLCLEAVDALLSMLKLLGLNCGLLLASLAVLYMCSEFVRGVIMSVQIAFLIMSVLAFEFGCSYDHYHQPKDAGLFALSMVTSIVAFTIQSFVMLLMLDRGSAMPFARRAASKGVTLTLLISYALAALFIATAALGTFGLLAGSAGIFGKLAASVVVCSTALFLAVAARLLRVLHASKIVHSKGLLGSLQSSNLTAFVISHHLGSAFLYYARFCFPLMAAATICILMEGWDSINNPSHLLIIVAILSFPIYDMACGTRMLILKESIWEEQAASSQRWFRMPACGAIILFLQNANFAISFGGLFVVRILQLKLFGNAQVLTPYSVVTCTAIYLANSILCANIAADAPAQIGIYLNARHAVNLEEIPESEFVAATTKM